MEAIKEIMAMPSRYKGGRNSFETVQSELRRRFGPKIAEDYHPSLCRSFREWAKIQYRPMPGAKAIKIITVVEEKDDEGETVKKFPKVVNLFNINQVKRIRN